MRCARLILIGCWLAPVASAQQELSTRQRVTPIVEVVREVGPTVVNLYANIEYLRQGFWNSSRAQTGSLGSGVIIHPSGIVVTNAHVITGNIDTIRGVDISVTYRPDWSGANVNQEMQTFEATLLGFNPENDLALLKIDAEREFPAAQIGTSSDLMVGETVVAVGNPFGREGSVTHGIISATHRVLAGPSGEEFDDLIQTDVPLNAGNSGGPLFNILGDLIGVNQAIGADRRLGRAEGQGLAIPVDRVRKLLENGCQPFALGLYLGLGLEDRSVGGVVVDRVDDDSPAQRAGLQVGDRILGVGTYEVDDRLTFNLAAASFSASSLPASDSTSRISIPVTTLRDGAQGSHTIRGAFVEEVVSELLGARLEVHERGLRVRRVYARGAAAGLGLETDDILFELGDQRVETFQDAFQALRNRESDLIPVSIYRYERRGGRRPAEYEGELRIRDDVQSRADFE